MNSTEIKIKSLLSVLSAQLERSTLYKQLEVIVSEMNILMSTALYLIAPTDERYHQVKKLNDICNELSLAHTNPQTERNSKAALIKSMLEECVEVIQALKFDVTYDSNGGTAVATKSVAYGVAATEPAPSPTLQDHVFRGWYTDDTTFTNPYDFATLVYDAITLYAKWLEAITLSFEENGGSTMTDIVLGVGEAPSAFMTEPDPTKVGNVFRGWYKESGLTTSFDSSIALSENTTIYAKWLTAVTATFSVDGGYAEPAQVIGTGEKVVRPDDEDQVKAGFQFIDWYTDGTFATPFDFATPVTGNVTIYAKYLEKFFVSYDSNDGSQVAGQMVLDGGLATEPTAPTKDGFTFAGWYTDDNTFTNLFDFNNNTITANITLFAKWV